MSLESNSWINTDHKLADAKENFDSFKASRGLLKIPSKQFTLPPDGRGDQSYHTECLDSSENLRMFNPNSGGPDGQQVPSHHGQDEKATMAEFPFCYNPGQIIQKPNNPLECDTTSGQNRFDVSPPFGYNYTLVNQMSLAAVASTFKCDICGLVFAHISLLNHHKRLHTNNSCANHVFTCEVCGATFAQSHDLKNHKNNAHPNVKSPTNVRNINNNVNSNCNANKKSIYTETEPLTDMTVLTPVRFGRRDAGVGGGGVKDACCGTDERIEVSKHFDVKKKNLATIAECPKCHGSGVTILGNTNSNASDNNMEKPYRCNMCDGRFSRYSSLWSHRRLHSGEKPFKCDLCGSTFARASSLKNHSRVHTGERPYKCNICGQAFSQAHHLKSHERIHSGERPYECEVCSKTFARHSTLWNHRRIHTGEKPYRCDICGTAFHQATHLKNHAKVHTGEKPHRCDICDVGFSDRFALKRHRGIHEKYKHANSVNSSTPISSAQPVLQPPMDWNSAPNGQQPVTSQQPQMEEKYKCNIPETCQSNIPFPGCSQNQEK